MVMAPVALKVHGVSRLTPTGYALHGVTTEFRPAEKVLLLGHNGAGKSTLLRLLSGLSIPDSGTIEWHVGGNQTTKEKMWSHLGYCSHALQLYGQLSVAENLRLFFSLRGVESKVEAEIATWGLSLHRDKRIVELSKGLQARVALAATFAHEPSFVLLDEPTSALDEEGAQQLVSAIEHAVAKSQALCIIASHDISRLFGVCDRVIVLEHGGIAVDSTLLPDGTIGDEAKGAVVSQYRRTNR